MITKSKIWILVISTLLIHISVFSPFTYAAKYNSNAYGAGVYSGLAADETDSCSKSDPNGDIRLRKLSPGDTHITAKFTDMEEPYNKFEIKWGVSSNLSENYLGDTTFDDPGNNTYTIENLNPDTLYYVKIRAVNGCNKGNWSDTKSVKTLPVTGQNATTGYAQVTNIDTTLREIPISTAPNTVIGSNPDSTSSAAALTNPQNPETLQYDLEILVVDENQNPIKDAEVLLKKLNVTQITGDNGKVLFSGLQQGGYELQITKRDINANTLIDINDPKIQKYTATVVLGSQIDKVSTKWVQGSIGVAALLLAGVFAFKKFRGK